MPQLTDTQRKTLEAALLLALVTRHTVAAQQAYDHLGVTDADPAPSGDIHQRLAATAAETALLVQIGVNSIMQPAEGSVYADQTPAERVSGIEQYNDSTLIPFLDSYAAHSGLKAAYDATPSPDGSGSMTDAVQWIWQKNTDFGPDQCDEAAAISPAPYGDLVSAVGGEIPLHRNCRCDCYPADWPN